MKQKPLKQFFGSAMNTQHKTWLSGIIFLIVIAVAVSVYLKKMPAELPDDVVKINGRTEADHYLASTKVSGKILKVLVREGDEVKKDQVLAVLDDAQVRAKVTQAAAAYGAAQARLKAAKTGLKVLKKQVPLQIATAESTVRHSKAVLNSAVENAQQAKLDEQRYARLYEKGTIQKHQHESAALAKKIADDNVLIAKAAINRAQKALNEAKLGWQQIEAKQDDVNAVKAQNLQAQAALMEAMSVFDDMKIKAPTNGVITTKLINEGEVIASGAGLFDIVNLNQVYLKGYIAENKVGLVHLGQKAIIKIDSMPEQDFPATVRYIASETEFTPKEVQTQDERVKLVYAIKLYLDDNPKKRITPGLPADAYIQVK
uniref:Multidrug resistance protein MdtA-like barrel-sandwich hybrid domain-containing protein n=1 Tax=Hydrogenovibrio crunogenus (strain DSM 25203 / XCL-2) TaxID=317025 RepID=Q31GJ5_HYDCU